MKKQITGTLAATAALLAIAGIVQAAPAELNIYGASAQYTYWNAQAVDFATKSVANGGLGCKSATAPVNYDTKHGFVSAKDCDASTGIPTDTTGTRDIDIRYSGIASAEGILAIKKESPLVGSYATGCNVANGERHMFASTSGTVCKQVHVGTSDVAGESLVQSSSGANLGPMGGSAVAISLAAIDTSTLTPANTVVVPFGFFVNKAVTAQTCTSGLTGNYCTTAAHCKLNDGTAGVCGAAATITNISREQANIIFSGYAGDWSDFGTYFTAQPVVTCLRHAGSGTHAALDLTVMNSGWGWNIATEEAAGSIYFNAGSSDEIKCVNGNSTATPTGSLIGAIGYADGDQATNVANTSQNVVPLKYNGFYPTRTNIRNMMYDFYTNAWLYTNPSNTGAVVKPVAYPVNTVAAKLVTYAQNPNNVPTGKANYWAAVGEMNYNRAFDNTYPTSATGKATIPMTP